MVEIQRIINSNSALTLMQNSLLRKHSDGSEIASDSLKREHSNETEAYLRLISADNSFSERKKAIGEWLVYYNETELKEDSSAAIKRLDTVVDFLFPKTDDLGKSWNALLKKRIPNGATPESVVKYGNLIKLCYGNYASNHTSMEKFNFHSAKSRIEALVPEVINELNEREAELDLQIKESRERQVEYKKALENTQRLIEAIS